MSVKMKVNINKFILLEILILLSLYTIHILFRLKDLTNFKNAEIPLNGYDAFYYASLTKLIQNDKYWPINYLINVPDFATNLFPKPLISTLPVWLNNIFSISVNTSFLYLPIILSGLFIFSLYFWLKTFIKDKLLVLYIVFISSLLISLNPIVFTRTSLGRFDTDALILFFIFLILGFINISITSKNKMTFIIISGALFNLFMWWYYKPVLMLFILFYLLGIYILHKINIKTIFLNVLVFILVSNPLTFLSAIYSPIHYIYGYIFKVNQNIDDFILPLPITLTIVEVINLSLEDFIKFTTGNIITLILAFIGIGVFTFKYYKIFLSVYPFMLLGIISIFAGNRFILYLSPFLGIGIAYFSYWFLNKIIKNFIENSSIKYTLISTFTVLILFLSISPFVFKIKAVPLIKNEIYEKYKNVKPLISQNAYIYSWWSYGNFLRYIYEKGTFISNMNFNSYKIYAISKAMMSLNENISKNYISFVSNNTIFNYNDKIKNLEDFKQIVESYNKLPDKDIYIFVYKEMFNSAYIYTLANIDENTKNLKINSPVKIFLRCLPKGNNTFDCGLLTYDKSTSFYEFKDKKMKNSLVYKIITIRNNDIFNIRTEDIINEKNKYTVEILEKGDDVYIVGIERKFENSIAHRMYILEEDNFKYFKKVYSAFPYFVVYKLSKKQKSPFSIRGF